jgi:hypothetical protein
LIIFYHYAFHICLMFLHFDIGIWLDHKIYLILLDTLLSCLINIDRLFNFKVKLFFIKVSA